MIQILDKYSVCGFEFVDVAIVVAVAVDERTHTLQDGIWIDIKSGSNELSEMVSDAIKEDIVLANRLESISDNIEALNIRERDNG